MGQKMMNAAKAFMATPIPNENPNPPQYGPITIKRYHHISYFLFCRSFEAILAAVTTLACMAVLLFAPGEMQVSGQQGLWGLNGRRSYRKLRSREEEAKPTPPTMMSADLVLMLVGALAVTSLISACTRVVVAAVKRFEEERAEEEKAIQEDPEKLAAKLAKEEMEKKEFEASNEARVKAGKRRLRPRVYVDCMHTEETMINVLVVIALVMCVLMMSLVQMRTANQVRGYGMVLMLSVVVMAVPCPKLDPTLWKLQQFCGCAQAVILAGLLFFVLQAVNANDGASNAIDN